MPLSLDTLRAQLNATELDILDLQHIERTEGAARAVPALPDAMHRREQLRSHIANLEQAARDAAQTAAHRDAVGTLRDAVDAAGVTNPGADALIAHVAEPVFAAIVPSVAS